jgi:hypothetical protein
MEEPAHWPAFLLVGMKGLEPSRLTALVPKTSVYTNFTTSPRRNRHSSLRLQVASSFQFCQILLKRNLTKLYSYNRDILLGFAVKN